MCRYDWASTHSFLRDNLLLGNLLLGNLLLDNQITCRYHLSRFTCPGFLILFSITLESLVDLCHARVLFDRAFSKNREVSRE